MPEEVFGEKYRFLSNRDLLSFEEIARLTRIIVRLGAVKLRITGGEPLVRRELEKLIALLSPIEGVQDLAMTTNGFYLPQKAEALKAAGLRRLTVSLDSLDEATFQAMNGGRATVAEVLAGLEAAEKAGFTGIKINAVIKRGVNEASIIPLARFCRERGYTLRFIEYMDVGTVNGWRMDEVVSAKEILAHLEAAFPLEPLAGNYFGEVALRYAYRDGGGEVGIIASVTQPFCGSCTRLRLSPQGKLYTCLFAQTGKDLREPLRQGATDEELEAIVRGTWTARTDRYSEERTADTARQQKIEMYYIGG
jgi:cyclic pyranopterin phosphate synthase